MQIPAWDNLPPKVEFGKQFKTKVNELPFVNVTKGALPSFIGREMFKAALGNLWIVGNSETNEPELFIWPLP